MNAAIWWIRRDLRIQDNVALISALANADRIVPVYIIDPALIDSPYVGKERLAFLFDGLRQLDRDLKTRGSQLVIRYGEPYIELKKLVGEVNATSIYAEDDFSPFARKRDNRIKNDLPLKLVKGLTIAYPGSVCKSNGTPYTVFTPFSRSWLKMVLPTFQDILPAPTTIPTTLGVPGLPVPESPERKHLTRFKPGEAEAQRRLAKFVSNDKPGIYGYSEGRNRLDQEGTSVLSPYLRFGMISAKQAVVSALKAISLAQDAEAHESARIWLTELIWREFYIHILHHFPRVRKSSFREGYENIAWENDTSAFRAWCKGETGYPVVDAAMRQLIQTGWMHNRARMIVASFLVKDLLIDWSWGEKFFMQHLVDGDPSANNGGWQWTAGTGTDAAPYFRIFNPILQGEKYDPDGHFVRRWVPELSLLPNRYIHAPWDMPLDMQKAIQCRIGYDYPEPIVDHSIARLRTLDAYKKARDIFTEKKN